MTKHSSVERSREVAEQLERARLSMDRLAEHGEALRFTTRETAASPITLLLAGIAGFALTRRRGRSGGADRTSRKPVAQGLKGMTRVLVMDGLIHLANRYIENARHRHNNPAAGGARPAPDRHQAG